ALSIPRIPPPLPSPSGRESRRERRPISVRRWSIALVILLSLALVPGLAWTAGFLYWHVRLTVALRTLDDRGGTRGGVESEQTLTAAGCRSLPYYVGALEPGRSRELLQWCSTQLPGCHLGIDAGDTPDAVESKCQTLRDWWAEHGREHHQSWRWWTGRCPR